MHKCIAPLVGSALVAGGVSLANSLLQRRENNTARAYNSEEAQKARDYSTFLLRNGTQIKAHAMREAGLNPAFENGSQLGSMPSTPSSPSSPNTIQPFDPMALSNIMLQRAQTDNLEADKDKKEQETIRQKIENEYLPALMKSQVNLNTSSYDLNIENCHLSKAQAQECAQNIAESEDRCTKIVGELNIMRKQVDIMSHEERIKAVEAIFKADEMKAVIANYKASAHLSDTQANDIVKSFVYRMYGIVSEAELNQEHKNVVYYDGLSKKLHFGLDETYAEPERIIGIVNGSVDALQGAGNVALQFLPAGKAAKIAGGLKQVKHLK